MKTMLQRSAILLIAVIFAGFVVSCDSDDDAPDADTTSLEEAITAAEEFLNEAVEGVLDGQYPAGSKTALQDAIAAAEEVLSNTAATQTQVDNAVVSLEMALEQFQAKEIRPIAEADLIAHWSFNEGTGTTANDNSANALNGTFKTGHANWGAGVPQWSADRYGAANKALMFNEGASVEIPYNAKLNPAQLSVALWINAAEINENNRFLGLHSWIGYKFQLQSTNRPFFTAHTAEDKYWDRDAEVELPIEEWHHIAVTFGGGKMIFYIDGTAVKTWEDTPGDLKSISAKPYNLVIGQDFPTDKYAATDTNFDNDQIIPLAWGGYFRGKLDEMRLYKTVLSASQIQSIYDREKP